MFSRIATTSGRILLNNSATSTLSRASIATSNVNYLKEIKIEETKDQIVVEGVKIPSDRTNNLVPVPKAHGDHQFCKTCPLCRLNLRRLSYSDTLILQQFTESNGNVMDQSVTGLCHRSQGKIRQLVKKAQLANLLPRPTDFVRDGPWQDLNTYFEYPKRPRDQPMRVVKKEYWKL